MTNRIGLVVAGALVLVLALAGGVTALVIAGGDPNTVQEVADAARDAAEDLDIDEGADLMCESPSKKDREELADLISKAQDKAGTDDPEVNYAISNVEGETEGSFDVRVTSEEDGLEDSELELTVLVEQRGDRSCIAGVEDDG